MKKIIHSLRNKPDHVKTRYVFGFAILATLTVVSIWIMTMRLLKTTDDTIKTESPFKVFGQIFKGAVSDAQNNLKPQESITETTDPDLLPENPESGTDESLVLPEPVSAQDSQ